MKQYLIHYRYNCFDEDVDCYARSVQAHRVEGWSEDYAFFGHKKVLDEVTLLVPRKLVERIEMVYDSEGKRPEPLNEYGQQAEAFYEAVQKFRAHLPDLSAFVGSNYVGLELDGEQSRKVDRDTWESDQAETLVRTLLVQDFNWEPQEDDSEESSYVDFKEIIGYCDACSHPEWVHSITGCTECECTLNDAEVRQSNK